MLQLAAGGLPNRRSSQSTFGSVRIADVSGFSNNTSLMVELSVAADAFTGESSDEGLVKVMEPSGFGGMFRASEITMVGSRLHNVR